MSIVTLLHPTSYCKTNLKLLVPACWLRYAPDAVELSVDMRFPLFGGWKTVFYQGYNVPIQVSPPPGSDHGWGSELRSLWEGLPGRSGRGESVRSSSPFPCSI